MSGLTLGWEYGDFEFDWSQWLQFVEVVDRVFDYLAGKDGTGGDLGKFLSLLRGWSISCGVHDSDCAVLPRFNHERRGNSEPLGDSSTTDGAHL